MQIELALLVASVVIVASITVVLGARSRAAAGLNRDLGNLRQMGQWTGSYVADFEGRAWSYTSAPNSQWFALRPTGMALNDAAKQAIDIIRRRTGREDFPIPGNWIPHVLYSHLVLADYADVSLPDRRFIATCDVHRMNWTDDPVNKHDQGFWQPYQEPQGGGAPGPNGRRWPYSSSYLVSIGWFDAGQNNIDPGQQNGRMYQTAGNAYAIPGGTTFGAPRMSEVYYPSQKVLLHDQSSCYTSRERTHFAIAGVSVTVLMGDGAAALRRTNDSNPGWNPRIITSATPTQYEYEPRDWEPPTTNGEPSEFIEAGYFRWTRGGVLGRDFGGSEIDTGQR